MPGGRWREHEAGLVAVRRYPWTPHGFKLQRTPRRQEYGGHRYLPDAPNLPAHVVPVVGD
jgi:hypothetical protein